MKKSNKILTGVFLTTFLIFLGIHLALYANIKSGNVTAYKDDKEKNTITHELPAVRYVLLRQVREAIIYASDTGRIAFANKDDEKAFRFSLQHDTLVVMRSDTSSKEIDWIGSVSVGVADGAVVQSDDAYIVLRGNANNAQKTSFSINANEGSVQVDTDNTAPFETLSITAATNAQINLKKARIGKLNITLNDAYLEEEGAQIDTINVAADASSKILFTGPNFSKVQTNTAAAHE